MSKNYKIFAIAWILTLIPVWLGVIYGEGQWFSFALFVHFIFAPAALVTIAVWIHQTIKKPEVKTSKSGSDNEDKD